MATLQTEAPVLFSVSPLKNRAIANIPAPGSMETILSLWPRWSLRCHIPFVAPQQHLCNRLWLLSSASLAPALVSWLSLDCISVGVIALTSPDPHDANEHMTHQTTCLPLLRGPVLMLPIAFKLFVFRIGSTRILANHDSVTGSSVDQLWSHLSAAVHTVMVSDILMGSFFHWVHFSLTCEIALVLWHKFEGKPWWRDSACRSVKCQWSDHCWISVTKSTVKPSDPVNTTINESYYIQLEPVGSRDCNTHTEPFPSLTVHHHTVPLSNTYCTGEIHSSYVTITTTWQRHLFILSLNQTNWYKEKLNH